MGVTSFPLAGFARFHRAPSTREGQPDQQNFVEKGQWLKEFAWPLSDGTTAELVIAGVRPGKDEIEILEANFEVAKRVLEKIAKEPAEGESNGAESEG